MPPKSGNKFCQNCAAEINPAAEICVTCGMRLAGAALGDISPKSRLAVTLLAILPPFLALNCIHRFCLGKTGPEILMLLTFGEAGIWALIDFIMAVSAAMKDKEEKPIAKWQEMLLGAWYLMRYR
jgi:TM2 domain-containing membrane protein YozV